MIRRLRAWTAQRRVFGDHGEGLRSTNRRILVNLSVFGMLFLLLAYWAFTNVIQLNAVERPYPISAEFTTSPGLHPGYAVTYLGVQVGRINSVDISGNHVVVHLDIDRGTQLPRDLDAQVRRKSAVGEPFVDLLPAPGSSPNGPKLAAGAVIGLDHTATPLDYSTVFESISRLFAAVPTTSLRTVLDTVAAGLQGRGQDIRTIITGLDSVTGTLASNAALLGQLADDLTQTTQTVVDHESSIDSSWNSLAALSQTLAESRQSLDDLLTNAPSFGQQVETLLNQSGPQVGCLFEAGATLWSTLDHPDIINALAQSVALSGPIETLLQSTTFHGPDGFYLNGLFVYNASQTTVTMFNPPLTLPAAPTVPACGAKVEAGSGAGAAPTAPAGTGSTSTPGLLSVPTVPKGAANQASGSPVHPGGFNLIHLLRDLVPYLALLALVAVIVLTRPWRYLRRKGGM